MFKKFLLTFLFASFANFLNAQDIPTVDDVNKNEPKLPSQQEKLPSDDLKPEQNDKVEKIAEDQIKLMVEWQRVGFIHGVMNTDNMSLSGETIDYGPCAFLDEYNPKKVFSSIDQKGRYAFNNQPKIALWNLARFAETILYLIDK